MAQTHTHTIHSTQHTLIYYILGIPQHHNVHLQRYKDAIAIFLNSTPLIFNVMYMQNVQASVCVAFAFSHTHTAKMHFVALRTLNSVYGAACINEIPLAYKAGIIVVVPSGNSR